jgi:hypothetical protein
MSTVFDVLEREWAQLADDSRLAGELPTACEAAGGAATLGQLERYVRGANPRTRTASWSSRWRAPWTGARTWGRCPSGGTGH